MKLDITLEIDNQTDKTISFDGINLTIYDPKTSKTYTFHPNGDIDFLVDPRKILEDEQTQKHIKKTKSNNATDLLYNFLIYYKCTSVIHFIFNLTKK